MNPDPVFYRILTSVQRARRATEAGREFNYLMNQKIRCNGHRESL